MPLADHRSALGADEAGPAGRVAAWLVVLRPQQLSQDRGLADTDIAGGGEQGDGLARGQLLNPGQPGSRPGCVQLIDVAATELAELRRIMAVPLPEVR